MEGLALSRSTVVGACDRAGNPFDLMVATTSGEWIRSMFGLDDGIQLDAATLNRGEKAKGAVIFDVPKTGVSSASRTPRVGRCSGPGSSGHQRRPRIA